MLSMLFDCCKKMLLLPVLSLPLPMPLPLLLIPLDYIYVTIWCFAFVVAAGLIWFCLVAFFLSLL